MTATKEVIGPAVGGLLAMLTFPVALLWVLKAITKYPSTGRTLCAFKFPFDRSQLLNTSPVVTVIYPGIFAGVGIVRGILGIHRMYLKWSQTVRDKEPLVEMRLRNLDPEESRGRTVEKKEEQEREEKEEGVQDLPVLDLIVTGSRITKKRGFCCSICIHN